MLSDCKYCIFDGECGVEEWKNHAYNKRDRTQDCLAYNIKVSIPPWGNPKSKCYGCKNHSLQDYEKCIKN